MKLFFLITVFVVCLIAQLFFMEAWQVSGVTPNLLIGFLVMSCLFINLDRMVWLGVLAGMYADFYSSGIFGLNIVFYVALILICKLLFKFGQQEYSWWKPVAVAAGAACLQGLIFQFPSIISGSTTLISSLLLYSGLTALMAAGWYLLLRQLFELAEKINIGGVIRK